MQASSWEQTYSFGGGSVLVPSPTAHHSFRPETLWVRMATCPGLEGLTRYFFLVSQLFQTWTSFHQKFHQIQDGSVVDHSWAFFSIPVDTNTQYLFPITWHGQEHTCTIMPQGFTEAPSYLSQVLHQDVSTLQFPGTLTLSHYVDSLCAQLPKNRP